MWVNAIFELRLYAMFVFFRFSDEENREDSFADSSKPYEDRWSRGEERLGRCTKRKSAKPIACEW